MSDSLLRRCSVSKVWHCLNHWLAPALLLILIAFYQFLPELFFGWVTVENGLVEILTALFAGIAGVGLLIFCRRHFVGLWSRSKLLTLWVLVFALACVYLCGEEISWGQHLFHWQVSEDWATDINHQRESNLHNISHPIFRLLLNKLPYKLSIVFAGIMACLPPLLQRSSGFASWGLFWRGIWARWSVYASAAWICSIFFAFRYLFRKVGDSSYAHHEMSEISEAFVALFFLSYAVSLICYLRSALSRDDGHGCS